MFERFEKATDIYDVLAIGDDFPDNKAELLQLVLQPDNFKRLIKYPYHLTYLEKEYSENKEQLFQIYLQPENFQRFVPHIHSVRYLAAAYPHHREALYQLVMQPENFHRLVEQAHHMCSLADEFPDKKEELFQLLVQPDNFQRLVRDTLDLSNLALDFCSKKEQLFQLIMQPDNFQRIVASNVALNKLFDIFPQHQVLIKNKIQEASKLLKEAKLNSVEQKAYTRGAAVGFFALSLPLEASKHIGAFLDGASGARLAQTTKSAASRALITRDTLPKPK